MYYDAHRRSTSELRMAMRERSLCSLPIKLMMALVFLASSAGFAQDTKNITDAAGRSVEIPNRISRVMAAGPWASMAARQVSPDQSILRCWTALVRSTAAGTGGLTRVSKEQVFMDSLLPALWLVRRPAWRQPLDRCPVAHFGPLPQAVPRELQAITRQFYKLFCQVDLTNEQLSDASDDCNIKIGEMT